jgi:TMEM175 potassium channel family protein
MKQTPFSTESGRLEAFSDGVLAVIITIMVLELKPPHGTDWAALRSALPTLATYVLSFVYIGIYWNNHHHMLRAVSGIDGRAMWLNLHLLFWLSLVPFTTSWLGENPTAPFPTVIYGVVLICSAIAFTTLQHSLIALNGRETPLAQVVRRDVKGKASVVLYALAIALAYVSTYVSDALFIAVALIWFIPDRRMERVIMQVHAEKRA